MLDSLGVQLHYHQIHCTMKEICCNLTDHIRLPIIHSKTYINIEQRKETRRDRIKHIILSELSPYNAETELSSHLAQQPNIYDLQNGYKITTCRFGELTRP